MVSRNVIQCYIGWGVVKNFQFLRYIIGARSLINTDSTDGDAPGTDAPYGFRHVLPSAASLAGVQA